MLTEYPPPWLDEIAPIDLSKPRVRGEEFLRTECSTVVLRVAGIYGPGRNPLNWIKTGRVTPSRKYVNLIHVDDLATICLAALERGAAGEAYNVSDGTPRTWNEIAHVAQARWGIAHAPEKDDAAPGKRIMTRKLQTELSVAIRHSDLYAELAAF
jgi:nucleoside-diphosphate-sugar epimerase